jgi:photosystem I P700 chlorophyll a apoprotein A2
MKEILDAHRPPGGRLGAGHMGLFETITTQWFSVSIFRCCDIANCTTYALTPYAFMSKDFTTEAALYTHHQYIAGF